MSVEDGVTEQQATGVKAEAAHPVVAEADRQAAARLKSLDRAQKFASTRKKISTLVGIGGLVTGNPLLAVTGLASRIGARGSEKRIGREKARIVKAASKR